MVLVLACSHSPHSLPTKLFERYTTPDISRYTTPVLSKTTGNSFPLHPQAQYKRLVDALETSRGKSSQALQMVISQNWNQWVWKSMQWYGKVQQRYQYHLSQSWYVKSCIMTFSYFLIWFSYLSPCTVQFQISPPSVGAYNVSILVGSPWDRPDAARDHSASHGGGWCQKRYPTCGRHGGVSVYDTVDGSEILHHLIYIPGGAGFLPSTVW